ncbi:DNA-deoxyinosine glycosylase [soil metagenome]
MASARLAAPPPSAAPLLTGLAPVVDARTRVLVLGSFPGAASLAAQRYYAHPQNQCWRLLAEVTGRPLCTLGYEARCAALLDAGIGLWDVYAACLRDGSLDSAIRSAEVNDFARLRSIAPRLERICHNGRTSGRFAHDLAALGFETRSLPSSSPAFAGMRFEAKLAEWREALELAA